MVTLLIKYKQCFNVDVQNFVSFSGNQESCFGYSLVLAGNKW